VKLAVAARLIQYFILAGLAIAVITLGVVLVPDDGAWALATLGVAVGLNVGLVAGVLLEQRWRRL
jgi:hypothetical protein